MSLNNDIFPESKGALINANFACNNESLIYVTLVSRYSKNKSVIWLQLSLENQLVKRPARFFYQESKYQTFVKSYFFMNQDTFCTNKVCEILWESENMFVTIL